MKPQLEQLEDRLTPTTLTPHCGPVVANPNLFDVYLQSAQPTMDQLARVMVGPYAQMFAPYGIHPGTFGGSATFSFAQSVVYDSDIQRLLTQNILAGRLPQPGPNEVYMVYLAPGQNLGDARFQGDSGYHSAFTINGRWVYYAVVRSQNNESVPASHEFAETLTDPIVGTGWFGANIGQEEADLENWNFFALDGFNVTLVTLPNGQVLPSSPAPVKPPPPGAGQAAPDLNTLLIERVFADLWGFLASLEPGIFTANARQAQATLTANPALATTSGQAEVALADQVFVGWLDQQQL